MRTITIKMNVDLKIRVNDESISPDNDAIAVGSAIERWMNNQPTINAARVDIGVVKMKAKVAT